MIKEAKKFGTAAKLKTASQMQNGLAQISNDSKRAGILFGGNEQRLMNENQNTSRNSLRRFEFSN